MSEPTWGLCASCVYLRIVESGRGSRFVMCQRARQQPAWPRYPRLPVLRCSGYQPAEGPST